MGRCRILSQCLKLNSREIDLRPGDDTAPHFVLTLVHGTWARGAAWMQSDSPFRVMIEEELCALGAASVTVISDFEWSGLNRHEDRREAALRLRCRLQQILTQHPNAFHFLIGHSHAGNIILRAISRWRRLQETLCGAICIATPFLKFHYQSPMLVLLPKMLNEAGSVAAVFFLWSCVSLLGLIVTVPTVLIVHWYTGRWDIQDTVINLILGRTIVEFLERIDPVTLICLGAIAMLLFGGSILYACWKAAIREFTATVEPERRRLLRHFAYFQPDAPLARVPVLALSSPIDEAYGALVGSWWAHRTATLVTRLLGIIIIVACMGIMMGVYGGLLYALFKLPSSGWRIVVDSPIGGFFLFLVATISLFIAGFVTLLLAQACSKFGPGLNLDNPQSSMLISSSAHREPLVWSSFRHVRFHLWNLLRESNGLLFHSRLYSCRPAIRMMAQWMTDRVKG